MEPLLTMPLSVLLGVNGFPDILAAVPVLIITSFGSISHCPALPILLPITVPCIESAWPDVSTKPPSPSLALMLIKALSPIIVLSDNATLMTSLALPSRSPPIITRPPPALPEASMTALSTSATRLPLSTTRPPLAPLTLPETSSVPVLTVSPPTPDKIMRPCLLAMPCA